MMEAVSISETSVNFYETTQCNIPEDSHLHVLTKFSNIPPKNFYENSLNYSQVVTSKQTG
jgi:hypothetical protein